MCRTIKNKLHIDIFQILAKLTSNIYICLIAKSQQTKVIQI